MTISGSRAQSRQPSLSIPPYKARFIRVPLLNNNNRIFGINGLHSPCKKQFLFIPNEKFGRHTRKARRRSSVPRHVSTTILCPHCNYSVVPTDDGTEPLTITSTGHWLLNIDYNTLLNQLRNRLKSCAFLQRTLTSSLTYHLSLFIYIYPFPFQNKFSGIKNKILNQKEGYLKFLIFK